MMLNGPHKFAGDNRVRFLDELKAFLRIPSISTLPQHRSDVDAAAAFVRDRLSDAGLEHCEIITTAGHPLVYADWLRDPHAPTVLCYGHYDVQPPDPLDLWTSPPFDPVIRNDNLYARGAADDKGQVYTHIKAAESFLRTTGKLPLNLRFIIEGEEEIGGESVDRFIRENASKLACDVALVSDTAMFAPDLPSIDIGLRGMVYAEIEIAGASHDLHSGLYGGAAPNPFEALARIICGLKSATGKIQIPGFYDRVRRPGHDEKESWNRLPFDEREYLRREVGSEALTGEPEFSVLERIWARPSLDIHGMPGGFVGHGAKTVIPARAAAKISMRLVPDQRPNEIAGSFEETVRALLPPGFKLQVHILNVADPVVVDPANPYIQAASSALEEVFATAPVFVRSGGSIPIVSLIASVLHAPVVLMGFGLPDDGLHAPNEKFHVPNFYRGIDAVMRFFERAADVVAAGSSDSDSVHR
jgi:acetylornithine deacetylase/succinyl-diaminopimelate desuccinylase-like protein